MTRAYLEERDLARVSQIGTAVQDAVGGVHAGSTTITGLLALEERIVTTVAAGLVIDDGSIRHMEARSKISERWFVKDYMALGRDRKDPGHSRMVYLKLVSVVGRRLERNPRGSFEK